MQQSDADQGSFPPWSRIPSLQDMCREADVGHDRLIAAIEAGLTVEEAARRLKVKTETVACLYEHFDKYGLGSVMGGD
ncbi:MAG: helix-turn-helix domain-containing protein [Syntrophomonadaceae bacterium]